MVLLSLLLACGEKETNNDTATATDTATTDTGTTEDTDTQNDTDNTEDTENEDTEIEDTEETDTSDTNDTEDTDEDPQWFEAGVYTGSYTCYDGFDPSYGIPMIDVKSTGNVSEIEVLNTSEQLTWMCSITEALNSTDTEWGVSCTGENSELFSSATVYSQGFAIDMNILFNHGPNGYDICSATFQ